LSARLAAALACAALLTACAQTPTRSEEPPLFWPPAPAQARIAYVKTIARPEDLGIERGFLRRLVDFVFGRTEERLVRPMAIVGTGGLLFVADPGARGVHRFDRKNGDYEVIRRAKGRLLASPVGLALGAGGDVYVADSELRTVFVIRAGTSVAAPLALAAELRQPTGIAYDAASGRLFVADTGAHCVRVFGRDGALLATIGRRGTDPGEFNYPTLLWRSAKGRLYVTDSMNFRVQIFDAENHFVAKFGGSGDGGGDLPRQKGVATDQYGHVYIVDSLFHAVQIFNEAGQLLLSFGALGRGRGEFWLPTGIFIGPDDEMYVADSYNRRVQVFRYIGGAT
jgi:DNA-binding beta-propeller fold protein YncE